MIPSSPSFCCKNDKSQQRDFPNLKQNPNHNLNPGIRRLKKAHNNRLVAVGMYHVHCCKSLRFWKLLTHSEAS